MMEDSYVEWLVKRKDPVYAIPVKILMVIISAFSVLMALQKIWGVLLMLAAFAATYFVFINLSIEFEYLYADDFEYKEEAEDYLESRGGEPRYMIDTHGAWIVEDGRLAQILTSSVNQWNGGDPMTIVGDFRWMNYIADVDITVPADNDSAWAGLGIRTQTGMNWNQDGYTLRIYGSGKWELYRAGTVVNSGSVKKAEDGAYHVSLAAQNSQITAFINGTTVCSYTDSSPMDAGRVKLSSSWTKTYFDNLEVKTIPGTIPYATSMSDGSDDSVQYDGNWMVSSAS